MRLFYLLLELVGPLVPPKPMSELTHEQQLNRTLRAAHRNGMLSLDFAAFDLGITRDEAERLLETLYDNGMLSKWKRKGVLCYKIAR